MIFKSDKILQKQKKIGEFWLNYCLQHQFDDQGAYLQHSTNYHRMVLDLLIWVRFMENQTGELYVHKENLSTIKKASDWLYANCDPNSGEMANYGHNDGAYLFQFSCTSYRDARPTLQALCQAYHFPAYFPPGLYDEKSCWLKFSKLQKFENPNIVPGFRLEDDNSWALLRVNQFNSRPGQADQNHVDIWYKGKNVVCDAGTYSYNMPKPWHNALRQTKVHNTVNVDGLDQMDQHGTFRWRNWSSGVIIPDQNQNTITGEHTGYKKLGITHTRQLTRMKKNNWQVDDTLTNVNLNNNPHEIIIHWLIKHNQFQLIKPNRLVFTFNGFKLQMEVKCHQGLVELGVIRAGICVYGNLNPDMNLGWYSPTYLVKQPALSIIGKIKTQEKLIQFTTIFQFVDC